MNAEVAKYIDRGFNLFDAYIFWTKNDKKTQKSTFFEPKTHFFGPQNDILCTHRKD